MWQDLEAEYKEQGTGGKCWNKAEVKNQDDWKNGKGEIKRKMSSERLLLPPEPRVGEASWQIYF